MNFSKFILSMSVASAFILGACSDTTDSITMSGDPLADEEGISDDESNSDSEDVEREDSEEDESSVKAKSSSSKAKSSSSVKEESKAKSSASTKDDDSKDAKSSASTKGDDADEAKSSSSSVKKRIPGMDDESADKAKSSSSEKVAPSSSSSSVKVVVSSSSVIVKLSSSSAVVVSSDAKDDGKVSSSSAKEDVVPSSDSNPAEVSSSSVEGYGDGSETVTVDDTTSIGTDQMDTVSSSESSYLDSLKQELEDETTDDPENFDILDSGNIGFGDIDTNNVYFCFTGDNEWLRINFEDMAKAGLPFLRNGHAWGLRKKYLVRFEEACEAVYVMRKER